MRRVEALGGGLVAAAVGYVLLIHLAVETQSPTLTVASLVWLSGLLLAPGLARRPWTLVLAGFAILGFVAYETLAPTASTLAHLAATPSPTASRSWVWLPLYAPSIAGDVFAAWVFGHTLRQGRMPLIERMARRLRTPLDGPLDPQVPGYARTLTLVWSLLFAVLGGINFVLALCAVPNGILALFGITPPVAVPQTAWSWFANVLEYGVASGFFVAEYFWRRKRFPRHPHPGLLDFVRRLREAGPGLFADATEIAE